MANSVPESKSNEFFLPLQNKKNQVHKNALERLKGAWNVE